MMHRPSRFVCVLGAVALLSIRAAGDSAPAEIAPRVSIPLDREWRFTFAEGTNDWAAARFDDSSWARVSLPHTWNAFDGQDGGGDYQRGTGWYRTRIHLPANAAGRRVFFECDGASRQADVFVNGKLAGSHAGAFARFRIDITKLVSMTGDNVLAVRVNNAATDIIPLGGDFTQSGGLYRHVRLLLTASTHIATLDYASPGVYLVQRTVSPERALVDARVKLANDAAQAVAAVVRVRVQSADGASIVTARRTVRLKVATTSEVTLPLAIDTPHLWNGTADPYLYSVVVELLAGGRVVDSVTQPLGLRSFSVDPDKGFILNGNHLGLHGVNRHQDRLDRGWAISEADQREDFDILRELGANAVRLAHYQHDQLFYSLCDRGGVAVWAELCFVNGPPKTPEGVANAKEQLRELVRQNYNHPSIFFWSLGNETRVDVAAADRLLAELAPIAREEDPTRVSVYASDHDPADPRNFHSDVLAVNKYFGWYRGDYADFGAWMDEFHRAYPKRAVGISEYGAGASIYQHEENPPVRVSQARGRWHPEEWQARFHEEHWLQIKERPYIWGTFIWNLFDFASDRRDEGDHAGRNDKGLVTIDRHTRKDAFYWYQANWTEKPMVHLVSTRFAERTVGRTEIRAYSNGDEVEGWLNGVSLGRKRSGDRRFVWPDSELRRGTNLIQVVSYRAGQPVATDGGSWNYRAPGDPAPNAPVAEADAAAKKKPQ